MNVRSFSHVIKEWYYFHFVLIHLRMKPHITHWLHAAGRIWPEVWLLPSLSPRGQRVSRNLKILLFVHTYKISVYACVCVCIRVAWCGGAGATLHMSWRCKDSWQESFLSYYKGPQDWTPIVSLGKKYLFPWRHRLSNPLSKVCYVFACARVYVCTPVEHRRQPSVSSLGIPSTSYKTGSLTGPDQPSRLYWPTREQQETSSLYLSST